MGGPSVARSAVAVIIGARAVTLRCAKTGATALRCQRQKLLGAAAGGGDPVGDQYTARKAGMMSPKSVTGT
jgi:hypothetical protein